MTILRLLKRIRPAGFLALLGGVSPALTSCGDLDSPPQRAAVASPAPRPSVAGQLQSLCRLKQVRHAEAFHSPGCWGNCSD